MAELRHIVVVGGGFGGLAAARSFSGHPEAQVTVIDQRNYHLFQPLLYQVAMAGLGPAEIAVPIRSILSREGNIEVLLGEVQSVNLAKASLTYDAGTLTYDYLILACGARHSYFGHDAWEAFAPGLKTIEEATEIRRRVLMAFELAEREMDVERRRQLLTFVVVGGGPTGVELAGAIGEISRFTLSRDFRRIDPNLSRIILIEAGPRILASFDPELSRYSVRALEALGVQIWVNARVTAINDRGVQVGNEFVHGSTVLWAAGVRASSVGQTLGVELDRMGRIAVGKDLSLPGYPQVFCIGDQAAFVGDNGQTLPGLAPVAIQQGRHVARNILRDIASRPRLPFRYYDKGQLATIGRRRAVLQFASFRLAGFLAWIIWLFVHIYFLIGFKNRVFVLLEWAWHYISYKRGSRLIVQHHWIGSPAQTATVPGQSAPDQPDKA